MKLNRDHIPLYYQVQQILRKKIASKEMLPDTPLPTENELCKEFEVSRTTVRQAFASLINEGLITRIPGKGTFLNKQNTSQKVVHYFNTTESLESYFRFATFEKKIHHRGLVTPTIEMAKIFDLDPGRKLYSLRGVRSRNQLPMCYFITSFLGEYADILKDTDLRYKAVLTVMEEKLGIKVKNVKQKIWASSADERIAKFLEIKKNDPLLVQECIYYTTGDKVIELGINYFHAGRYYYEMNLQHKM